MTKNSVQQADITILHVPKNWPSQYVRQKLIGFQEETDEAIITTVDFNISLSQMDRPVRQNCGDDIIEFNNTISQFDMKHISNYLMRQLIRQPS